MNRGRTLGAAMLGMGLGVTLAWVGSLLWAQPMQPPAAPAAAVPQELVSYREIVKKVLPAVVSIEAKSAARAEFLRRGNRLIPFDPREGEVPELGFGSGVIVDPSGIILTNYHVVDGADAVEVTLHDGRKFISRDIKVDRKTDLAIVRITAPQLLPALEFGDSDQMEVGDRVLAIGAPFGLTGSVTHGIVSAKSRNLRLNQYEDFLQTDAAINPGNSGGPLVNLVGQLIGINSAIKSRSGGWQGVGLAISSNLAKNVMQQLAKNGVVKRGYLGVQIKDLDAEIAARLGLGNNATGALIARVFPNAPAAKSGIQDGDIITSIGNKPIRNAEELKKIVANLALNQPTEVVVLRDGQPTKLKLTIEEQPEDYGNERVPLPRLPRNGVVAAMTLEEFGLIVCDLTPELAEGLGFRDAATAQGALVLRVAPGSVAEQAGLVRGIVITKVDTTTIRGGDDLREALKKAHPEKGALLQVRSPLGGSDFLLMKVPN